MQQGKGICQCLQCVYKMPENPAKLLSEQLTFNQVVRGSNPRCLISVKQREAL